MQIYRTYEAVKIESMPNSLLAQDVVMLDDARILIEALQKISNVQNGYGYTAKQIAREALIALEISYAGKPAETGKSELGEITEREICSHVHQCVTVKPNADRKGTRLDRTVCADCGADLGPAPMAYIGPDGIIHSLEAEK